jgi:hypothetical protein
VPFQRWRTAVVAAAGETESLASPNWPRRIVDARNAANAST